MTSVNRELLDKILLNKVTAKEALDEVTKEILEVLMQKVRYNQSKAADELEVTRTTCRTYYTKYFGNKYIGHRNEK